MRFSELAGEGAARRGKVRKRRGQDVVQHILKSQVLGVKYIFFSGKVRKRRGQDVVQHILKSQVLGVKYIFFSGKNRVLGCPAKRGNAFFDGGEGKIQKKGLGW
jgi:hypothetical protein